jgi:hypothetical protein
MDTIKKIRKLRHKRSKTNQELLELADTLGIKVNAHDRRLLELVGDNNKELEACEDARDRLLIKLDAYHSGQRSKLSSTLSLISVMLSIVAALLSIYASLLKS